MKRKVFAIALALMLLVPVFMAVATEFKNYRWAKYHLKFKLPEHWNVTTNTATEFIAKGSNIVLKIEPYKNSRVSADGVAMYGYRTYSVVENKKIMLRNYGSAANSRVKANLWGSGEVNGRKVYWRIMALVSQRDDNNVYCRAWWYDGMRNTSKNSEDARAVQHSLDFDAE